jgi:plasmid rolling circle replication initiator protein Rep
MNNSITYLSDYATSKKDEKWDSHRESTQNIESIFKSGEEIHTKQAGRMSQCSGSLSFGWSKADESGETKLKLKQARFCHVRSCPVCQWRRSMAWQARMFRALEPISKQFPTHRWLMLSLTVRNCEVSDLKATIKSMQSAFMRLRKRKDWPAHGYIKSLEVTRGRDGSAHPHFHILTLVPSGYFGHKNAYITSFRWSELWMQSLRVDYLPVVDIRKVKSKNPETPHDVSSAVVEVLKYETKVADLEKHPDFLLELAKQLVRVRAVEVGGILKEYLKTDEPDSDEELIGKSDEERLDELQSALSFNWNRSIKKYVKK